MLRKRWAEQADLKRCILHSRRRTACANRYAVSRRRRSRLLQAQWIGSQGCSISSLGVTAHTSAPRAGHRNSASLAACPARPAVVDRESRIQSGCGSAASEAREWLRGTPRARHDFVYDDADPEHEAVIDTVIVRQCSVLNFPASIRPHCAAGRIRGALSSASPSIGRIERVELVSASNKLVKLTVDFADRRCSVRSLEPQTLCQF
jgi:hypothetical protein